MRLLRKECRQSGKEGKASALGKVNGIAQREQMEPAKMTEEEWPGKKMGSRILMDGPIKKVFKQRETVSNISVGQ